MWGSRGGRCRRGRSAVALQQRRRGAEHRTLGNQTKGRGGGGQSKGPTQRNARRIVSAARPAAEKGKEGGETKQLEWEKAVPPDMRLQQARRERALWRLRQMRKIDALSSHGTSKRPLGSLAPLISPSDQVRRSYLLPGCPPRRRHDTS